MDPYDFAMDPVAILSRTALFREFAAAELEPLVPAIQSRTYPRGAFIFHEGDPGTILYVIRVGQVKIGRVGPGGEEMIFAILMPGDFFGELALFDQSAVRTADAQAIDVTECLTLQREPLMAFLERHPPLMGRLLKVFTAYIRQMDSALAEAAFLDIPGRVARKLLALAESHGERTSSGVRIEMKLSQRTLAGMVGASRENVNRSLRHFIVGGAIAQDGGYITIVKPAELRKRG
jgi:CRP/FNR family transcriptional regulator/CRP/FNR family cyclic AMP-dependent transcriptional regulator